MQNQLVNCSSSAPLLHYSWGQHRQPCGSSLLTLVNDVREHVRWWYNIVVVRFIQHSIVHHPKPKLVRFFRCGTARDYFRPQRLEVNFRTVVASLNIFKYSNQCGAILLINTRRVICWACF